MGMANGMGGNGGDLKVRLGMGTNCCRVTFKTRGYSFDFKWPPFMAENEFHVIDRADDDVPQPSSVDNQIDDTNPDDRQGEREGSPLLRWLVPTISSFCERICT